MPRAGTDDQIGALRSADALERYVSHRVVQFGDVCDNNPRAYVNVYRDVAFSVGRLPAVAGLLSGSGLAAPSP